MSICICVCVCVCVCVYYVYACKFILFSRNHTYIYKTKRGLQKGGKNVLIVLKS